MINDAGKQIYEATPGQAVKLGGFRHFPDVGTPLYACETHDEALQIGYANKMKKQREKLLNSKDNSEKSHEL